MKKRSNSMTGTRPAQPGPGRRTALLMGKLEALPGTESKAMSTARAPTPGIVIYKVMGKMFAIVAIRGAENVILKCDPNLVPVLRRQYAGIGHRSHLDRRYWISVDLDADVPAREIERLAEHSYGLVCAALTRKQQDTLASMSSTMAKVRK